MNDRICYVLDSNDNIVYLSDSWSQFARQNDAPELTPKNVLGTSIWTHLTGLETKKLFLQLFNKLRATRQTITIPFRCDSPDCHRYMTMRLTHESQDGIRFDCILDKTVAVKSAPLSLQQRSETGESLKSCSMCKRIEVASFGWLDVVDAILHEPKLQTSTHPPLADSICPDCLEIGLGYSYVFNEPSHAESQLSLLVFLHGAAQANMLFRLEAPPRLGSSLYNENPMLIVSPVLRESGHWDIFEIIQIIQEIKKAFKINTNKIVITGISLGAIAAINLAMKFEHQFAAIVPIASAIPSSLEIEPLTHLPMWFFHGKNDPVFPCQRIESLVELIQAKGGQSKLTIYPETGHDAWSQAYHEEHLWTWIEHQKRLDD